MTSPAVPPLVGPALLRGLDHVAQTTHGYQAECPICRGYLAVTRGPLRWQLECATCTEDELSRWLRCDLTSAHPTGDYPLAVLRAIRLAPTLEVCQALLRGERVPVRALDPVWARRYRIGAAA